MASRTLFYVLFGCLLATSLAQQQNYLEEEEYVPAQPRASSGYSRPRPAPVSTGPKPTPVPILKQINRHNEDGSYTYGYEGADGSFKIETKLVSGEVMGKYGYVDDNGKVRVVEYGANKFGFMPSGEGITVAPPTLVDETTDKDGRKIVQDYDEEEAPRPAPKYKPAPKVVQRPQSHFDDYEEPRYQAPVQQFAPAPRPQPQFAPAPRPAPRPVQHSRPPVQNFPSFPSSAPVPPRASIPGAAPVFSPAPVYEEPRPAPARLPSLPPQPVYRPQPQHHETRGGRSGILDQLAKDYALPQGQGRPTHDITFGSY